MTKNRFLLMPLMFLLIQRKALVNEMNVTWQDECTLDLNVRENVILEYLWSNVILLFMKNFLFIVVINL